MATVLPLTLYAPSLLDIVAYFIVCAWIFFIFTHIVAIFAAKAFLYKFTPFTGDRELSGVSILKPIVGEDENLQENLRTFFELQYPKFEILFCFQDEHDPAVKLVRRLMESYPHINAKVFASAATVGVNPKINNMLQGYRVASYDILWICDSAIKVQPHTLQEMMSHMDSNVGLVHQLPFVTNTNSIAGVLEKVYFGTQHARIYLFANAFGILCANGMCSLISKPLLEEVGGLQAFSCYIAEDYFIAKSIYNRGYKVVLSSEPCLQNQGQRSIYSFKQRMIRWTRLRLTMQPFPSILEPLTECVVIGLLVSWAMSHLRDCSLLGFLLFHVTLWFACDQILLRIIQGKLEKLPPFWKLAVCWLFRELWTVFIFILSATGRHISWRTTYFKLFIGGKAELLQDRKCQDAKNNHCF